MSYSQTNINLVVTSNNHNHRRTPHYYFPNAPKSLKGNEDIEIMTKNEKGRKGSLKMRECELV